jgi:hypothetical protein
MKRRRQGSLVGPLLIIMIGVWFLVSSLRPDLPLLDLAARYWPFVLIGWGALRLLEILSWAMRRQPLPAAGISGGEWTAVVLLSLFGAINRRRPTMSGACSSRTCTATRASRAGTSAR